METVAASKKLELIKHPLDTAAAEQTLADALVRIQQKLGLDFPNCQLIMCEDYFQTASVDPTRIILMKDKPQLVGYVLSVIGSIAITEHDGNLLGYNLKKYIGYQAQAVDGAIDIEIPSTQLALF